jgi:glycosyltransferase involved in cell wall biosynthesis
LRILMVTSTFPVGPGETFLRPEVEAMADAGHDLLVVPMRPREVTGRMQDSALPSPTLVAPLIDREMTAHAIRRLGSSPARATRLLARACLTWHPVHSIKNLAVAAKGLWLADLARSWKADHIHAHWASTSATLAWIAHMDTGIPWSITAHSWDIADNNLFSAKAATTRFVRFISNSGLRRAGLLGIRNLQRRAHVVHLGVHPPAEIGLRPYDDERFRVWCVANLEAIKGHEFLLSAVALLRDRGVPIELRLAGEGTLRGKLDRVVRRLGLQSTITFMGLVPHDALMESYRRGDVQAVALASTSEGYTASEGIPVALMEAMGYGVPCVGTATGGIPELLEDGAGLLVAQRDPEALADALERLYRDPDERLAIGAAARRRVVSEFDAKVTAARLLALMGQAPAGGNDSNNAAMRSPAASHE